MEALTVRTTRPNGKVVAFHREARKEESLALKVMRTGKLVLTTFNGFTCLRFEEIVFLKAESNYTEIHTSGRRYLFSKTLKSIEKQLPQELFCRIHKSYIVNVMSVKEYVAAAEHPHLILENNTCLPVSRSRKTQMKT